MHEIIECKMKNRVGVLNRLTGLLTRRNINIESALIASTPDNQLAVAKFRIYVAQAQEREHLKRVIAKQIDVLSVNWCTDDFTKNSGTN
ncbi:ACT domain-containing protein [Liquorilactobacillus capillatus]|uniref:ACT domain-containing protein n=1 Tax=Liquorilactobacillus capillatus DSM 19910 TaxID=1423731 RepID=A0A0R1M2P6_9LACO|nr:ACT domain-containing protein [Liquorilactobacillus capillatus]KRL01985.1 hypothetical protein FC81_GL000974 [Liquorilactobacillus capillatus DSM 19910]